VEVRSVYDEDDETRLQFGSVTEINLLIMVKQFYLEGPVRCCSGVTQPTLQVLG